MARVFITGGAGFIGKPLSTTLVAANHSVTVFDNLHPQVHSSPESTIAELETSGVDFINGDVRHAEQIRTAIFTSKPEIVVHLAAETGTGQSYDLPGQYCEVNVTGTARLIEGVRGARAHGIEVRRLILAGSRAVYGEGACVDDQGRERVAVPRAYQDLVDGDFMPKDAAGNGLIPVPSCAATTAVAPASIYASTKLMQEFVFRQALEHSGIECGILRLQNVYGAGQSLNNPYTGVLSIFAQQLLSGDVLAIYEDGAIVRDFVYVSDVVNAFRHLCETDRVPDRILDVGSGQGATILDVARMMIDILELPADRLTVTGQFRPGDIRHAVADIGEVAAILNWQPEVNLQEGISALLGWARDTR